MLSSPDLDQRSESRLFRISRFRVDGLPVGLVRAFRIRRLASAEAALWLVRPVRPVLPFRIYRLASAAEPLRLVLPLPLRAVGDLDRLLVRVEAQRLLGLDVAAGDPDEESVV